jgi:DNA-binding transcriptional ArsR family regulator
MSEGRLRQHPAAFVALTGLRPDEFEALARDVVPALAVAEHARRSRPGRRRAVGGGHPFARAARARLLLTVIWLRQYPTAVVLGFLFGVSHPTVLRALARTRPVLEQAGLATLRPPARGRRSRRDLDDLLRDVPELAVLVDTFEQRVQRPRERAEADRHYSGKKKQHTLKSQVAVEPHTGRGVDVSDSVCGPTHDLALLRASGLLDRLPPGVGVLGDLAHVGVAVLHPHGLGFTPRRKPRGRDRPPEDVAYNTAFASARIPVEHTIGRMRRYQALTQPDRHHRRGHAARVRAVAGLANRQLEHRFAGAAGY